MHCTESAGPPRTHMLVFKDHCGQTTLALFHQHYSYFCFILGRLWDIIPAFNFLSDWEYQCPPDNLAKP